jgi:hypothetical protein
MDDTDTGAESAGEWKDSNTVYIVMEQQSFGDYVHGVYTSRERAVKWLENRVRNDHYSAYEIIERTINEHTE